MDGLMAGGQQVNVADKQNEVIDAAQAPDDSGARYFLSVLETEDDPVCKWHAVRALGQLQAREAMTALLNVLREPDTEFDESSLHRICAWSLGQIGPAATTGVLTLLDNSHSTATTCGAIDALGEIADAKAVPALASYLGCADRQVSLWSGLALGKIGQSSLPVLSDSLKGADKELVFIVVDILAIIGTKETVPVLSKALDANPEATREYFKTGPRDRVCSYAAIVKRSEYARNGGIVDLLFG